jgi:3D (Asp-Asp-Asp) domain-containing protein/peptidoglycan hydrolase CwlO-like protein
LWALYLAALTSAALAATLPAGGSAESVGELERQAQELRDENQALATGAQSAAGELVAIEGRLTQARAELSSFRAQGASLQARRRALAEQLALARMAVHATQRALARRLQGLYEQEDTDTLALILGAGSLDEALNAIEAADLVTTQDESLVAEARSASARLTTLNRRLAERQRQLEQLAAARAAAAASLVDARSERLRIIASLGATRRANAASLLERLEHRARELASVPPPLAALQPGRDGVRSVTVLATGYALGGRTASGRPVGWGVVAVDPSVIPLGSRLVIPGYGLGVAADTGGAIQGARIDLWFPTLAEARAWGSRVVTITVSLS